MAFFHFGSKPATIPSRIVSARSGKTWGIAIRLSLLVASLCKIELSFTCEIYFVLLSLRKQTKQPRPVLPKQLLPRNEALRHSCRGSKLAKEPIKPHKGLDKNRDAPCRPSYLP
jgi:hypothetical protein